MSTSEVIEEVKSLNGAEKRLLRQELNEIVSVEPIEFRLQRALFTDGLLGEIKPPFVPRPEQEQLPPIEIKGKPLSETILEERHHKSFDNVHN